MLQKDPEDSGRVSNALCSMLRFAPFVTIVVEVRVLVKLVVQPQQIELPNAVILGTVNPLCRSIDVNATSDNLNDDVAKFRRMTKHTTMLIVIPKAFNVGRGVNVKSRNQASF